MNRRFVRFLLTVVFALVCSTPTVVSAAWSNGQAADIVLGQPDFVSVDSPPSQTLLGSASGVCYDPNSGSIFVVDYGASRVLRWASGDAYTNGSPASSVLGQADFDSVLANRGGVAAANTLNQPFGCAVSSNGTLWVSDMFNNRVLRFDDAANKADGADADGVLGQANFSDSGSNTGGLGAGTLAGPWGVSVDGNDNLYVGDWSNNRVLFFADPATKANGGDADQVFGQGDFVSGNINRGGAVAANTLASPTSAALDANGDLWISDSTNRRVLRYQNALSRGNGPDADQVLGQVDMVSNMLNSPGGVVNDAGFSGEVYQVSVDRFGTVYVADRIAPRFLIFENAAAKGDGGSADYVLGQVDFASSMPNSPSGTRNAAGFISEIMGPAFDYAHGRIWVVDRGNRRVLSFHNSDLKVTTSSGGGDGSGGGCFINTVGCDHGH